MILLLIRVFSIFLTVFLFGLIAYVAWKKFIRPALHKERLEGEIIDAQEAFDLKRTREEAEEILEGSADEQADA